MNDAGLKHQVGHRQFRFAQEFNLKINTPVPLDITLQQPLLVTHLAGHAAESIGNEAERLVAGRGNRRVQGREINPVTLSRTEIADDIAVEDAG